MTGSAFNIFCHEKWRNWLLLLGMVTIVILSVLFACYSFYQKQSVQNLAKVQPEIERIIDISLSRVNNEINEVRQQILKAQRQLQTREGVFNGLRTDFVGNKAYTFFKYSDLDILRSINSDSSSKFDNIIPAQDISSFLLLIPTDHQSDLSLVIRANKFGPDWYGMTDVKLSSLAGLLPKREKEGCEYTSYLLDGDGKIIVSTDFVGVGAGIRRILSEKYPIISVKSEQLSDHEQGTEIIQHDGSTYGLG